MKEIIIITLGVIALAIYGAIESAIRRWRLRRRMEGRIIRIRRKRT